MSGYSVQVLVGRLIGLMLLQHALDLVHDLQAAAIPFRFLLLLPPQAELPHLVLNIFQLLLQRRYLLCHPCLLLPMLPHHRLPPHLLLPQRILQLIDASSLAVKFLLYFLHFTLQVFQLVFQFLILFDEGSLLPFFPIDILSLVFDVFDLVVLVLDPRPTHMVAEGQLLDFEINQSEFFFESVSFLFGLLIQLEQLLVLFAVVLIFMVMLFFELLAFVDQLLHHIMQRTSISAGAFQQLAMQDLLAHLYIISLMLSIMAIHHYWLYYN